MTARAFEEMRGTLVALLGTPSVEEGPNEYHNRYVRWERASAMPALESPVVSSWWEERGVVVAVSSVSHPHVPHLIVAPSETLQVRLRRKELHRYFRTRLAAMQRIPRWKIVPPGVVTPTIYRHDTPATLLENAFFRRGITLTSPEIALAVVRAVLLPEDP